MTWKFLYIDDDERLRKNLPEIFTGKFFEGEKAELVAEDFVRGQERIATENFDLVILDHYRGEPREDNTDRPGANILASIKTTKFIPVIFFTGVPSQLETLKSPIVRVVSKGSGIDALNKEIIEIFGTGIPAIQRKFETYIKECFREYFWDFIDKNHQIIAEVQDEISLGYLIIRRLSHSLTKEQINQLLGSAQTDRAHPMEVYVYPPKSDIEYTSGCILEKDGRTYVTITPDCDYVQRTQKPRKAEFVLLAECIEANVLPREKIESIILKKTPRYFFLPKTHFLSHRAVDFQKIYSLPYAELSTYARIAVLDYPFAQSLAASFSAYYGRIGSPDFDKEIIMRDFPRT